MRNSITIGLAIILLCSTAALAAEGSRWQLGVQGGYSFLPLCNWNVDVQRAEQGVQQMDVDDDSYLDPSVFYGLSCAYSPRPGLIRYAVGLEADYSGFRGELRGDLELDGAPGSYDTKMFFSLWQAQLLAWLYFYEGRFTPYAALGPGLAYVHAEFDGEAQQVYAPQVTLAAGVDMYGADWVCFGLELRFNYAMDMQFDVDLNDTDSAEIELDYLPLSALMTAKFNLF
ncbi:MAG: outer membrane beta-barrel protein [Candidatus Alcyoniella australis]|nr:outer membrane beta-barrel protein [Candidatus Alcyoniella australis]